MEEARCTHNCQVLKDRKKRTLRVAEVEMAAAGMENLPKTPMFPRTVGLSSRMAKRNRYKDVVPYDHNRVIVPGVTSSVMEQEEEDYINASYIRGSAPNDGYIVTQGPMFGTLEDFWTMVWSQNSTLVVMMSRLVEHCQSQSYRYWPDVDDHLEMDELTVSTEMEHERSGFISRTLVLTHRLTGERRPLTQLQFLAWPELSNPCIPTFIHFWRSFKRERKCSSDRPPILHSSDGSQRTGTLVALDILMNQWETATSSKLDVHNCVFRLREDRMNLVSSEEYHYLQALVREASVSTLSWRRACVPFDCRQNETPPVGDVGNQGEITATDIEEEYQFLRLGLCGMTDPSQHAELNDNDPHGFIDSNLFSEEMIPGNCFLAGNGNVTVCCVPIHHPRHATLTKEHPTRMRRSVSIQQHTEEMGLGGVLPPHCRRSFLVTPATDVMTSSDFWQMIFDTGCRAVVRLVPLHQERLVEDLVSCPAITSDLTVTPLTSSQLSDFVTESTLTLDSNIVPIPTVDGEQLVDQPIKVLTLRCLRKPDTGRGVDAIFFVFRLLQKWLDQTNTGLVAVNRCAGALDGGLFCAAFNSVTDIATEQGVDVLLNVQEVQSMLYTSLSMNDYRYLHHICQRYTHALHRRDSLEKHPQGLDTLYNASLSAFHQHCSIKDETQSAITSDGSPSTMSSQCAGNHDNQSHETLSAAVSLDSTCSES